MPTIVLQLSISFLQMQLKQNALPPTTVVFLPFTHIGGFGKFYKSNMEIEKEKSGTAACRLPFLLIIQSCFGYFKVSCDLTGNLVYADQIAC